MNLIPVTFQLTKLADNFGAEIELKTRGAEWTVIGSEGDESLGFSCNETILNEARPVSIQSVELTKTALSIMTGAGASQEPITVTAVLCVPSDIKLIEADCTINDGARVFVRFGSGAVIEWGAGRNSGSLPSETPNLRFIRLAIGGWTTGRSVAVEVTESGSESFQWAMGQGMRGDAPFSISASNGGGVQVGRIAFSPRAIMLYSCGDGAGWGSNEVSDLLIETYIERIHPGGTSAQSNFGRIGLSAKCDPGITVIAQIPGQRPKSLTSAPRDFYLG
ncbi:MAG TPA: hypothetical protein VHC91_12160 [Trinickia sp.]|uniref:hypothetical protein n=1 Tax=Trinickia sp. TaxID=2571163 RepID=UPI002B8CF328|nr:hypothetical protein [Trinickia sp.]HVW51130.1 hypothetical protein [Trinickia sp.]